MLPLPTSGRAGAFPAMEDNPAPHRVEGGRPGAWAAAGRLGGERPSLPRRSRSPTGAWRVRGHIAAEAAEALLQLTADHSPPYTESSRASRIVTRRHPAWRLRLC